MAYDNKGKWIVGSLTEIKNDNGDVVGITDRHPATVQVEEFGNPIEPQYRMIDGNGKTIDPPQDELEKLLKEVAIASARTEQLKLMVDVKQAEKAEDKSYKDLVAEAQAVGLAVNGQTPKAEIIELLKTVGK